MTSESDKLSDGKNADRMHISELNIPDAFKEIYRDSGIEFLYPPQAKAVRQGLLDGENILAAIPTACGKTLLAELAMIRSFQNDGKALYIVPLRALASEKYRRFSEFEKLGVSVGISTGDFDSRDEHLGVHDWIVATSEKVDSLFRNETTWLSEITAVVLDEIHLLDSPKRGPTLEITVAKLRRMNPKIHIVGLSATVGNAKEIARWLNAKTVVSEWRPTELKEGIFFNKEIVFKSSPSKKIDMKRHIKDKDESVYIVTDVVKEGGQCLVFESSRKNTESFCKKSAPYVKELLSNEDIVMLSQIADELSDQSETELSKTLSECIQSGAAFHHAGLSLFQREYVEKGFLKGFIKMVVATPTLAAGLNLPARRVLIRSYKRYEMNEGMKPISVIDYKQMAGRAGRPNLDPYGESVLLASREHEIDILKEKYINAKPESIFSKLAAETVMRTHVLSTVSNGFALTKNDLLNFFKETFFAHQEGMISTIALNTVLTNCLNFLIEKEMLYIKKKKAKNTKTNEPQKTKLSPFVRADLLDSDEFSESEQNIFPTEIGRLVSKLYIDPMTAAVIIENLICPKNPLHEIDDLAILHLICTTPDMRILYLKANDYEWIPDRIQTNKTVFLNVSDIKRKADYEWFLGEVKTAMLLSDWIREVPEKKISERYDVGEGDIRSLSETAEWIVGSAAKLARFLKNPIASRLRDLEIQLKYGADAQLLSLLKIKNVGRVRARLLYNAGFHSKEDILSADVQKLIAVLGVRTTERILASLNKKEYSTSIPLKDIFEQNDPYGKTHTIQKRFSDFS